MLCPAGYSIYIMIWILCIKYPLGYNIVQLLALGKETDAPHESNNMKCIWVHRPAIGKRQKGIISVTPLCLFTKGVGDSGPYHNGGTERHVFERGVDEPCSKHATIWGELLSHREKYICIEDRYVEYYVIYYDSYAILYYGMLWIVYCIHVWSIVILLYIVLLWDHDNRPK